MAKKQKKISRAKSKKPSKRSSPGMKKAKSSSSSKSSKYVTSRTPKSLPRALRPLKRAAAVQKKPKVQGRDYTRLKAYRKFAKQFKRRADKKYWKEISNTFKQLYDKKGQPIRIVMINVNKKYVHNTKNRLAKTKIKYKGREKWRKGPDGKWKRGRPMIRNKYRDKLLGNYIKGKNIGKRFLKVMEKDLVRKYMKKHRIKNYNKAKKKFWEQAEKKSIYRLVQLYGGSP